MTMQGFGTACISINYEGIAICSSSDRECKLYNCFSNSRCVIRRCCSAFNVDAVSGVIKEKGK